MTIMKHQLKTSISQPARRHWVPARSFSGQIALLLL